MLRAYYQRRHECRGASGHGFSTLFQRVTAAGPGQSLVTSAVVDSVIGAVDAEFVPLPARHLKGLTEPVPLASILARLPHARQRAVDGVCDMTVDEDRKQPRRDWRGDTYHFCSERCADEFIRSPDRYAAEQSQLEKFSWTAVFGPRKIISCW